MPKFLKQAALMTAVYTALSAAPAAAQVLDIPDGETDFSLKTLSPRTPEQGGQPNGGRMMVAPAGLLYASFDTNSDYAVDAAELSAGIMAAYQRAERSGNGVLSLVEVDDWRADALGSIDLLPGHTQFDQNIDARVTQAEFSATLNTIAAALDRNDDGVLQFGELLTAPPRMKEPRRQRENLFDNQQQRRRR